MSNFLTTPVRVFSLLAGVAVAFFVAMTCTSLEIDKPWGWGLLIGAAAAIVISLLLTLSGWHKYRIYREAESRVEGEVLHRDRVFLRCGRLRRVAYLFLTRDAIHLYLWDKRPFLETTASRAEVTIEIAEEEHTVFLSFRDREPIYLMAPDWEDFIRECRMKDYTVNTWEPNRK